MNTDTTDAGIESVAFGSSFINIATGSENKINLCDLKFTHGTGAANYFTASLQILNGNGTTKTTYYWFYNRTHGGTSGIEGWYTDSMGSAASLVTPESGIFFKAADGFWLTGAQKLITSSGAVLTGTQIAIDTTPAGIESMMIANPYPVAIDLADITFEHATGAANYFTASAQILNGNGTTKTTYYYFYNRTHGGTSGIEGWYTDSMGAASSLVTKESNIKLQPGEAYWVTGASKTLKFPALNLN